MALNPSIILQGRGPDVLGAMGQGNALAQQTFDMQRQGDMQRLYREQGVGIAAGEPTAINALAGMDPMAAMGVQRDRLNMDIARRNDGRADQQLQMQQQQMGRQTEVQDREWQFRMQEYARGLSAEDAAAQAAQVEDAVKMGLGIQDAQTWDQMMAQQAPELVGQFDQRDALAQRYMSVAEILKQQAGPAPMSTPGKIQADIAAGILPQGTSLQGSPMVSVTMPGQDKFDEAFAGKDADALATISDAGIAAQRNLGRIEQLESLLSTSPSGLEAIAKQALGERGINTEGLDAIQAAQALINSLVPEQRQPGSGPMSDADLALFKQSLPRLVNQPGGNETIISTMRSIAQYDAQGAQIAQAVRDGSMTRAEGFQALRSRPNPMDNFRAPSGNEQTGSPRPIATPEEYQALQSGAQFTAPDGTVRRKP